MQPLEPNLKTLPFSLSAEQSVLGGIIQDNTYLAEMTLTADDFHDPYCREVFIQVKDLYSEGKKIDIVTLSDRVGDIYPLAQIVKETPSAKNTLAYAEQVLEKATYRRLVRAGERISDLGYCQNSDFSNEINNCLENIESTELKDADINTPLKEMIDDLDSKCDGSIKGFQTGFNALEERFSGIEAPDLITIAGRPGMGKTAFALNLAVNNILQDKPVLFFSLEMGAKQLVSRAACSVGSINTRSIKTGKFQNNELERLSSAVTRLKDKPLFIEDTFVSNISMIEQKARYYARKHNISAVFIDYIQRIKAPGNTRYEQVSEITRRLKLLAADIQAPVFQLSQLNRSLESRADKRPIASDLKESGSIEEDSDIIMFLYRDEFYDDQSPMKGTAEAITAKYRHGEQGTDFLKSELHYSRFSNLEKDYERNY